MINIWNEYADLLPERPLKVRNLSINYNISTVQPFHKLKNKTIHKVL
jgi:hypothetical protein